MGGFFNDVTGEHRGQLVRAEVPVEQRPYSQFQRVAYGLCWTAISVVLVVGFFVGVATGEAVGGLVAGLLGLVASRYAYRLWTWQARRLVFFIIF